MRTYIEDAQALTSLNESAMAKKFEKMNSVLAKSGKNVLRHAKEVLAAPEYMKVLTESIKLTPNKTDSQYVVEDMNRINTLYENIGAELLNESTSADLSPIAVNSFGIQERALIAAHLPRAVKQVTAKVDSFKLTERIPYITDLAGNRQKFIDAFVPNADGNYSDLSLREIVVMGFNVPSVNVDLMAGNGSDTEADDYRPAVTAANVFGLDSALDSIIATNMAEGGKATFEVGSLRSPDPETGNFAVTVTYPTTSDGTDTATIMGQFDFSKNTLVSIMSSNANVTGVKFKMVLSPETHQNALTVGYEMKHTGVYIPVGEHFEYCLSEEFKDASDKYYNTDAMALLTDYMGRAVEQVKDIVTLGKFQELAEGAVVKTSFNCTPSDSFAQGKEEFIRREFAPFIEKVCIILKNKVRIPNCHFRVIGNPIDVRVAASAGTEYIYKRNESFGGEIAIDYEFSVASGVHKIFYISSERIPAGKLLIFLVPNSIENNISTVNHYEYATYVSNKYKGTKSNLPTVMISTRYLTKEYYPVVATVEVLNNLTDDTAVTTATGTGLEAGLRAKVNYVNA